MADRGAMGGQAVEALVDRGHRDGDQLAFELAQIGAGEHQVIVEGDKGLEFFIVEGIGLEHVRHHAELVLAFGEICGHLGTQRCFLFQVERGRGLLRGFHPNSSNIRFR